MGNALGGIMQNGLDVYFHPEVTPVPLAEPAHDPNYGFPNGRKERVMIATKAQLESAKIPIEDRDYCAHLLLKLRDCKRENWPFPVFCSHETHAFLNCKHDDFVIRMKEFERERRLKVKEHLAAA